MDVDAIKSSASLVQIAGRDTKLTRRNNEYHGCCPLHNESTPSFTVFNGKKGEQFHCFGCGESGDVIEYVMKTRGVKFVEACRIIAGDLAVDGLQKRDLPERVDKYAGITPAPNAPRIEGKQLQVYNPNLGDDGNVKGWQRVRFAMAFEYAPGMAVLRIEMKDGGKWTPQIMWCTTPDGKTGWAYMPMPEPRPLYGLTDAKQVIVVQGEKKADQLRARFAGKRCVVCSSGGDNAVAKTDWEQLTGRDVIIWPDADDSGREAARYVAQRLEGKASRVRIMRTDDLPRKWDVGDMLTEAPQADVLGFMKERLEERLEEPAAQDVAPPMDDQPPVSAYNDMPTDDLPPEEQPKLPNEQPFRVLGYNNGRYYYFPYGKMQIVSLTAAGHTMPNLLQLARLEYWEEHFGGGSQTKTVTYAANALIAECERYGVFLQEDMARGAGAWLDEGRHILHCGDQVIVDGKACSPREVQSEYVYVASGKLIRPAKNPLTNAEAHKLREICEMPSWENKLSGSLLAGWIVIAPVCAMLKWRPHIWITGEASAGKSTVKDEIIGRALGNVAVTVDGGTTEPALRQMLGYDSRPVIYDEAESETQRSRAIMDEVLQLARKASRGGYINKFGQEQTIRFQARSCFCFCGINPVVRQYADQTRISMMVLKRNSAADAAQHYAELVDLISQTLTPDFSRRLLARTVNNMSTLLDNVQVFEAAARRVLANPRAAEQIGPMLAGLYLLSKTSRIDIDAAEKWIRGHDWTFHTAINQQSDQERLLQYICTIPVKVSPEVGTVKEVSIGRLILCAMSKDTSVAKHAAENKLRDIGIWPRWHGVLIANRSPQLEYLLRDTPWAANWARPLSDLPGAEKIDPLLFAPGFKQRSVSLPLALFEDKDEELHADSENNEK